MTYRAASAFGDMVRDIFIPIPIPMTWSIFMTVSYPIHFSAQYEKVTPSGMTISTAVILPLRLPYL